MADQLASAQAVTALQTLVESIVDQRLRAAGVVRAAPGPRELRIQRGLEIREVAERSGISAAQISRIERNTIQNPSPQTLNKIARGIGVSENEYRCAVAQMVSQSK